MKVMAVITDPQQVRRILRHLVKTGAAPLSRQHCAAVREAPDLDLSSLS